MTPYLAFDVSRCQGTPAAQCSDCLRRIAPGSPLRQVWIAPPEGAKTGACESRIADIQLYGNPEQLIRPLPEARTPR